MFTVQELDELIDAGLDATGSQRYLFDQDKKPAINSAISRAITAGGWALANRKGSEEMLWELKEDKIFQSNFFGGIAINDALPSLGHTVWNVLAVYAEPEVSPPITVVSGQPNQTIVYPNNVPLGSKFPVQRMTAEQVAVANTNIFMSGNETLAATPMRTYGYYYMGQRVTSQNIIQATQGEIFITPRSLASRKLFWVSYLRTPATITAITDNIDLPRSFMRTLASWALEYLSFKQGDGTTLNSVASKDAGMLFNFQVD